MVCEGGRRPVTCGARSQVVGRSKADNNSPLQKHKQSLSACCLQRRSRAQLLKPKIVCCCCSFAESQWRGARCVGSWCLSRKNGVTIESERDVRWSLSRGPEWRRSGGRGSNGCDAQSARYNSPSRVDVGSSGVKRERPIGPRKSSRGRIGGPESLKPLVALTIYTSFTAKSSLFIDLPIGFRSCVMRR